MWYEGVDYPDDNAHHTFDVCITLGDVDRLHNIARKNNIHTNGFEDLGRIISYVIREYYKEHEVAKLMTMTTGIEHREYEDFLKKMKNR